MKMRKMIAFLLAIVMAFSFVSTAYAAENEGTSTETALVKGDVDGDYIISNADLILMARFIVGYAEPDSDALYCADVNWDGELTNADLIVLAKQIVTYSGETPELAEEMEEQMIEDFVVQSFDDLISVSEGMVYFNMVAYFGSFNDCEAVLIERRGVSAAVQVNVEVNELKFTFPHPMLSLYLYKDSQFLKIDEAFEAGWITAEDLTAIWNLREGDFGYSGENNVEISKELKSKIVSDFADQYGYRDEYIEQEKQRVKIRAYYGTYSGCEAVMIQRGGGAADVIVNVDAAGYRFSFPDTSVTIYLYKDSQFLRIDEAFEEGWITAEDVADIWNIRGGFFAK